MSENLEIRVPDLGDFADVEIIEIHVAGGDVVAVEDPVITLETDKAAMDVPSPAAGKLAEIRVAVGDKVSEGDVIAVFEGSGAEQPDDTKTDSHGDSRANSRADSPDAPQAHEPPADEPGAAPAAPVVPANEDAGPGGQNLSVAVPDLGDFAEVEVIEVHIVPGDEIAVEDPLITLETDKAAMDVPAPAAGKVVSVAITAGQMVSAGDPLLEMIASGGQSEPAGEAASAATDEPTDAPALDPAPRPAPAPPPGAQHAVTINEAGFARAHASPSVRKLARELGVDLARVNGSGAKGRILASDVKTWVKSALAGAATDAPALPGVPKIDFSKFGPVDVRPLSRIQKISGPRLHASWVNLPHVTQHDEADITDLEARRQDMKGQAARDGIRLTPLAFVMRAVALALTEFPGFNASLSDDGKSLVFKQYCHLGFAADTPNGLVVPVIRDADAMSVLEFAQALAELSEKAREGKLGPDDMQGGCFTVSSLGGIGGTAFTPIINAPEVAILGVSRSWQKPVFFDGKFVPRLTLPLSLSYDHRVIDGAAAVRFTTHLGALLGDPDTLMKG